MMRAIALVLLVLSGAAQAATVETPLCRRDRLVADGLLLRTRDTLLRSQSATQAAQCSAWREHVDAARKVQAIYGRCVSGAERDAMMREMKETETAFSDRIAQMCKGL
jgi:hypothetical protein